MPSAFISHTTPDDGYVAQLETLIRSMNYSDVFNDSRSLKPDERFWPEIVEKITVCDTFFVVVTAASGRSQWVQREVELARDQGKSVIPILIEDCERPAWLDGRRLIDFRSKSRVKDRKIAPSRILRHSPEILFGRDRELDALDAAWHAGQSVNVYTLVAWGGVGKTSLVAHWVSERIAAKGWPGVERYFDWSFYSQGTGESRQTSSDLFIAEALRFFGDPDPQLGNPWDRGERLAGLVRKHRTLLVLDGIEPLQYPPTDAQAGRLKDQALAALVMGLAADNPGLCIITTRESLTDLRNYKQTTAPESKLDKLLREAAIALLRHLQIVGTEEELAAAWKDASGHALTLQLLGRFIVDAYPDRDIRHRDTVHFEEIDAEHQGRSAFKVMIAYEKWLQSAGPDRQRELALLRLTGLFDRPISPDCLTALRAKPAIPGLTDTLVNLKDTQWNTAINRLASIDLISFSSSPSTIPHPLSAILLDAHPLIREYFAIQLKQQQPDAFRAAHSRLFDHLCTTTEHRPDTLDGLQTLYQAVIHGCLAGRQPEACDKVYVDRILRGTGNGGYYSSTKLGAIGADLAAVAAFFDQPWSRLSPNLKAAVQAWLHNEAASRLNALGHLTEALEPMRVGLKMAIQQKVWKSAAVAASNLSELEVKLGLLGDAVADARRSIDIADRSGEAFQRMSNRTAAADALYQSGNHEEALSLFQQAEAMQRKRQPEFDRLYSLAGFRYCDLLLAPAERTAWQPILKTGPSVSSSRQDSNVTTVITEVKLRATQTLGWGNKFGFLLDIALNHLILARVTLYRVLLENPIPSSAVPNPHLPSALNGLRQAGTIDELPKALLTAAWYHHVTGDTAAAKRELDEAQQIAERGPMPLYLADVHLHRARLFHDRAELAKAGVLIRQLGYGRRDEELADAEEAAKGW